MWKLLNRAICASVVSQSTPLIDKQQNDINCKRSNVYLTERANELIHHFKELNGIPGISVSVSVAGNTVYETGIGYADVENLVAVHPDSVFRIASISKSLTSLIVGQLLDKNAIDLDADIKEYVSSIREFKYQGKNFPITTRLLLMHRSGIRHYHSNEDVTPKDTGLHPEIHSTKPYKSMFEACNMFIDDELKHPPGTEHTYTTHGYTLLAHVLEHVTAKALNDIDKLSVVDKKDKNYEKISSLPQISWRLYSGITEQLSVVTSAITEQSKSLFRQIFENKKSDTKQANSEVEQNNCCKNLPSEARFSRQLDSLFNHLGLTRTIVESHTDIIPGRVRQYSRDENKSGSLQNTPYVNNSYKIAGGGILSTTGDLLKVAHNLCDIYMMAYEQSTNCSCQVSKYLKGPCLPIMSWNALCQLWSGTVIRPKSDRKSAKCYALGWSVSRRSRESTEDLFSRFSPTAGDSLVADNKGLPWPTEDRIYIDHSGGAVGGTTFLLMSLPGPPPLKSVKTVSTTQNSGRLEHQTVNPLSHINCSLNNQHASCSTSGLTPPVCVAILTNLQHTRQIRQLAENLANLFTDSFYEKAGAVHYPKK